MALILSGDSTYAEQSGLDSIEAQLIGVGQTWQDMTASRSSGVTYTNNTGKPLMIVFSNDNTNEVYVDGLFIAKHRVSNTEPNTTFIVPNGSTYRIDGTFGTPFATPATLYGYLWAELR